jgi:hypothetical protein
MLAVCTISLLAACTNSPSDLTAQSPAHAAADATPMAARTGAALVRREMPREDPGPPFYARVGMQVLEGDGYVAIPFYRSPDLVPAGFNLMSFYDFPGPGGPGAFAAPLLMTGFTLTEADAAQGTFPKQVELHGAGVPVWFVPSAAFHAAAQDRALTIGELRALSPLVGTASRYHESLHPRESEHKIVIEAAGTLADGRSFSLNLTHVGDALRSIRIAFR